MIASVVLFEAPWCLECKAMAPHVAAIAAEYSGSVELERIDVSVSPEIAAKLNVMATPTIIARHGDAELFRVAGRRTPAELRDLFAATAAGTEDVAVGREDRMLRIGSGAVLTAVGVLLGPVWPLVGTGAGLMAWGLATGRR